MNRFFPSPRSLNLVAWICTELKGKLKKTHFDRDSKAPWVEEEYFIWERLFVSDKCLFVYVHLLYRCWHGTDMNKGNSGFLWVLCIISNWGEVNCWAEPKSASASWPTKLDTVCRVTDYRWSPRYPWSVSRILQYSQDKMCVEWHEDSPIAVCVSCT